MNSLILGAAIFLASASPMLASDNPAAQQILDTAQGPGDLFQENIGPFQLDVDFTAQFNVPAHGHLTIKWKSKDQWWSEVSVSGFEQTTIRNGQMEHTVRNLGFTPNRVSQLFSLVEPLVLSEFVAKKQNGVSPTCVQAHRKGFDRDMLDICVDPASHNLLSEDWRRFDQKSIREEFADYIEFSGIRYPRKFELLENGGGAISANVTSVHKIAFDPALLVAPKGAIERRRCPGMKPPGVIYRPAPTPPSSGSGGNTSAAVTILTDGSVGNVHVIDSGGKNIDDRAVEALKKWKFKPAMCGSEPVVADIMVGTSIEKF